MSKTNEGESDRHSELPPITTGEDLSELRLAYRRAFDRYSDAVSKINACVRRRSLPTAEEFARRRVALVELMDARRALGKAQRRRVLH